MFLGLPNTALPCSVAIVLAVDVSGSVDMEEYRIQTGGLAEALRDGAVAEALVSAKARLALVQWTGSSRQTVSLPWRDISDFDSLERFAADVAAMPRAWRHFSTAVGEALKFSISLFPDVPVCRHRVIDVSGDGISNEGVPPTELRSALSAAGITVNALVIEGAENDLTAWFWENVIHGSGAFVVTADGFAAYPARIRQKLLREVTEQTAAAPQHLKP